MNTENENSMSPDHPHGKPDPRWITDDGRCLLCADSYHKGKIRELEILLAEKNETCNIFVGQVKKLQAALGAAEPQLQFWLEHARDGEDVMMPQSAKNTLAVLKTVRAALGMAALPNGELKRGEDEK